MKQLITKINREKGFTYKVDKEGNVYKESYNWFKDPYTLVAIAIILIAGMYYLQITQMKTTEKNFETSCITYWDLRTKWMQENPGKIPTLKEVFEYKEFNNKVEFTMNEGG